jgi:HPt (histidine-containing phosphotransfer) domain-containing protein
MPSPTPGSDDHRVRVKQELAHLMPFFISNRRDRIHQAREHCDTGDLAALRGIGHDFKGACGSYGFQLLSRLGAELEHAPDLDTACTLVQRIHQHLEQVQIDVAAD